MNIKHKVWFNKTTAIMWVVLGIAAFFVGWKDAVWFVVVASVYANVKADWSTAEAADDRAIIERFKRLEEKIDGNRCTHPSNCSVCLLPGRSTPERRSSPLESGGPGTASSYRRHVAE